MIKKQIFCKSFKTGAKNDKMNSECKEKLNKIYNISPFTVTTKNKQQFSVGCNFTKINKIKTLGKTGFFASVVNF